MPKMTHCTQGDQFCVVGERAKAGDSHGLCQEPLGDIDVSPLCWPKLMTRHCLEAPNGGARVKERVLLDRACQQLRVHAVRHRDVLYVPPNCDVLHLRAWKGRFVCCQTSLSCAREVKKPSVRLHVSLGVSGRQSQGAVVHVFDLRVGVHLNVHGCGRRRVRACSLSTVCHVLVRHDHNAGCS